jgi:prepilin-type N-terminal cleavage/methylation domain-containing protein
LSSRTVRGFTLIEIMAVVLIIGLTMAIVLPNLGGTRVNQLRGETRSLAGRLELARQRAIVTGVPHRVMIFLNEGGYRVEWYVTEQKASGEDPESEPAIGGPGVAGLDPNGEIEEISLLPPTGEERDYYPVPNRFGESHWMSEEFFFVGVQTPEGWIERGKVQIVFQRDGTSDSAEIVVEDAWNNSMTLEVQPLFDQVRIRETRRS